MKSLLKNVLRKLHNYFPNPRIGALTVFVVCVLLDQLSKIIVLKSGVLPVYFNRTVAFSLPIPWYLPWIVMIAGGTGYLLMSNRYAESKAFLIQFSSRYSTTLFVAVLISAGAISNLIDRFFYNGSVVDFINVHYWPVFNFADSFIVCGLLLFVYTSYIKSDIPNKK